MILTRMSKLFLFSNLIFLMAACNQNEGHPPALKLSNSDTDNLVFVKSSCTRCHDKSTNAFGPSIYALAEKFSADDIPTLVESVKDGKRSNELTWGTAKKPASDYTRQEIKSVIEWMLGFNDQPTQGLTQ